MSHSVRIAVVERCTAVLTNSRWMLASRNGRRFLARMLALRKMAARGLAGGVLVAAMTAGTARANGPFFGDLSGNGNGNNRPALVDIDNDGDQDAFIGSGDGTVRFYRNTGSAARPIFTAQDGADNPLNGVTTGTQSAPAFVDIDNDGDQDVFIGSGDGTLRFFRNTGSVASPTFIEMAGPDNPFTGVDVNYESAPAFVDIDNDGDQDAFIGSKNDAILFYRNEGIAPGATTPTFTLVSGEGNPFNGLVTGNSRTPTFVDIDNDGDQDAFIGSKNDPSFFYRNEGIAPGATTPTFVPITGEGNPFNGVNIGTATGPDFVDIDNDGDQDAFIGTKNNAVYFYRNTGTATTPAFTALNPFGGSQGFGNELRPTFVDIDNDGDLDAFVGSTDSTLRFFRNTGTPTSPTFTQISDAGNPFNGITVGQESAPTFGDIDNDGDQDALIGSNDGTIRFYRNTPADNTPVFAEVTGPENPFNGVDVGNDSLPSLVDIDNDGDQDVFIGTKNDAVLFYRNIGSPTIPVFTEVPATEHPFAGLTMTGSTTVEFVDIDNDGDQDAYLGQTDGTVRFFRNVGNAATAQFIAETGTNTALSGLDVGTDSAPAFADIDSDGDQDAFIGTYSGGIIFQQNVETRVYLPLVLG